MKKVFLKTFAYGDLYVVIYRQEVSLGPCIEKGFG